MKKRVLRFGGDKVEKDILERLYRRHTKAVYLYLYSLCHDHALAEDLMQETFLRAFCTLELSETAILPWLLMPGICITTYGERKRGCRRTR